MLLHSFLISMRGDAQHVRFKGSPVSYALLDIEKILRQEELLKQHQAQQ
jgi:hypothetical protein